MVTKNQCLSLYLCTLFSECSLSYHKKIHCPFENVPKIDEDTYNSLLKERSTNHNSSKHRSRSQNSDYLSSNNNSSDHRSRNHQRDSSSSFTSSNRGSLSNTPRQYSSHQSSTGRRFKRTTQKEYSELDRQKRIQQAIDNPRPINPDYFDLVDPDEKKQGGKK